jgi:hypothetical protein
LDKVTIMCATWNVNAKPPPEKENLKEWLLPENTAAPDIYAIGLQEIVDLNVMNIVIKNSTSVETSAAWVHKISKVLSTLDYYKVLLDKTMVGTVLVIFVKASLHGCIRDVKYAITPTGSSGLTGNKGGIAISMKIHDSPVCFVCAHFHANRDNVAARNQDYLSICDNSEFISVGAESSTDVDELFMFPRDSDSSAFSAGRLNSTVPGDASSSPFSASSNSNGYSIGYSTSNNSNGNNNNNNNNSSKRNSSPIPPPPPPPTSSSSRTPPTPGGTTTFQNPIFARKTTAAVAAASSSSASPSSSPAKASGKPKSSSISSLMSSASPKYSGSGKGQTRILEHEYVFWVGDLNYR